MGIKIEFLCTDKDRNMGYFDCIVQSGKFCGYNEFCMYVKDVKKLVISLSTMYNELYGSCKINDMDSDSYIEIEVKKYGHIDISGQIGGSHRDNYLVFKLSSDQTQLIELIQELKKDVDLIEKSSGEKCAYDAMGNLSSIKGNNINQSFTYNGNGQRLSKTDNGKTITYVNDINTTYEQVLQTYDENDTLINTYDYGIERIRSTGQTNETYLYDATGNVVGSITQKGTRNPKDELITYKYTAYGDLTPDSPQPTCFGYNGEDTDYTTGLQYLRARYYDVTSSRFIQKDIYRGEISNTHTLNRYAYVGNNPIMHIDPSGHRRVDTDYANSNVKYQAPKAVTVKPPGMPTSTWNKIPSGQKTIISNAVKASKSNRGNSGGSSGGGSNNTNNSYSSFTQNDHAKDLDGDGTITADEVVAGEFGGQLCSENKNKTGGERLGEIFGAGSSSAIKVSKKEKFVLDLYLINTKVGTTVSSEVSSRGDSSKPISVYAKGVDNEPLSSSAGLKINITDTTINVSFGLSNIGVSYNKKTDNGTNIYKGSLSIKEAEISALVGNSKVTDNINVITGNPEVITNYEESSVDLARAVMVYLFLHGAQTVELPTGVPAPAPVPVPVN